MINEKIEERFDKYGLWLYSDDNIISSSKEKYWTDSSEDTEDIKLKNDFKELRWTFHFNYSRIKVNKVYHVVYILSIPEMFPISNGKIDYESINDINFLEDENSSSSMRITNKIDEFRYTISFEDGIELKSSPECVLNELNQSKKHPSLNYEYNIIYNKYTCNIKKPKLGSKIMIKWNFKGGNNHGKRK